MIPRLIIFLFSTFYHSNSYSIVSNPVSQTWVRLNDGLDEVKLSPKGRYIAYRASSDQALKVFDTKTKNVFAVTQQPVGSSFFWAPGDSRLIYKEMGKDEKGMIKSIIKSYDCNQKKSIMIEELPFKTGVLTFDPKDHSLFLLHEKGIHTKKLIFPDNRLARWQKIMDGQAGRWVGADHGVLWVSRAGLKMRKMEDDGSSTISFDVSPDGKSIAWATEGGRVYVSYEGADPLFIDYGKNPNWHPHKNILIFSGARMVGKNVTGYDLKVFDHKKRMKWITETPFSNESWPNWTPDGERVVFTKDRTTDLYSLEFQNF